MAEKLIHLPADEPRAAKWRWGREQYGPVFIGHPLEEFGRRTSGCHELRGRSRAAGLTDGGDSRRPSAALRTNPGYLPRGTRQFTMSAAKPRKDKCT